MTAPQTEQTTESPASAAKITPMPVRHKHPVRRMLFKVMVMAVIFLAGGVSGWLYGVRFAISTVNEQKTNMRDVPNRALPRLEKDLALTPEQLPEFERIFRKYHSQMTEVEAGRAMQVHQYFYEMGRDILPLLDETQQAEFREIHHRICAFILGPIPRMAGESEAPHDPCDDL